jgi:extracellular matrix regulatory protein A
VRSQLLHVGFDNVIAAGRIVAIIGPSSAPVKRMIREAAAQGKIIDMTNGRKMKSVIVLDSGHVALAALAPETLSGRFSAPSAEAGEANDPVERTAHSNDRSNDHSNRE